MILYIVIPCYNEQEVISETAKRLEEKLSSLIAKNIISIKSRIVFVNDGSTDGTWGIIEELHGNDKLFAGINLTKNEGHQNAILAGLMSVKGLCDAAITMDADLQDDINAIDEMVDKHLAGSDVVYGVRSSRKNDTFLKRFTAESVYRLMSNMGVDVVFNHADYRLMSKRAIEALEDYKEVNLFLRGIVPLIGFESDVVYYERNERFAGESKFPLPKMLQLAVNGVTSFSIKPLRIITALGCVMIAVSLIAFVYIAVSVIFESPTLQPGWPSIMASIWLIGGIQILCIGVIGEYIGKIYFETKARPKYIVERFINEE